MGLVKYSVSLILLEKSALARLSCECLLDFVEHIINAIVLLFPVIDG